VLVGGGVFGVFLPDPDAQLGYHDAMHEASSAKPASAKTAADGVPANIDFPEITHVEGSKQEEGFEPVKELIQSTIDFDAESASGEAASFPANLSKIVEQSQTVVDESEQRLSESVARGQQSGMLEEQLAMAQDDLGRLSDRLRRPSSEPMADSIPEDQEELLFAEANNEQVDGLAMRGMMGRRGGGGMGGGGMDGKSRPAPMAASPQRSSGKPGGASAGGRSFGSSTRDVEFPDASSVLPNLSPAEKYRSLLSNWRSAIGLPEEVQGAKPARLVMVRTGSVSQTKSCQKENHQDLEARQSHPQHHALNGGR